jgi:enamine deaminase RidA (YjgF/YER057c/UK114 family)
MSCQFLNPKGAVPPHRNLYKNVSISPVGSKMCYVATQYSADENGNILHPGDYQQQSKVVWTNISKILEGIGARLEHVMLKTVTYA